MPARRRSKRRRKARSRAARSRGFSTPRLRWTPSSPELGEQITFNAETAEAAEKKCHEFLGVLCELCVQTSHSSSIGSARTSYAARPVSRVATGRTSKRGLADRRGGVRPSRHHLPPDRRPLRRHPPIASGH